MDISRDLLNIKRAQASFSSSRLPTLGDLVSAIRADRGLTPSEQQQLLRQVQALTGLGTSNNAPLSSLMYKGLGGTLGYVISKYFGLGMPARLISAAAGFGVGSALHNRLNRPPDPFRGTRMIGS